MSRSRVAPRPSPPWRHPTAVAILLLFLPSAQSGCARSVPPTEEARATFLGAEACRDCHPREYASWTGSDHDLAMQEATEDTVLADFNDTTFEQFGKVTRFYRKDGTFRVSTEGPGGRPGDYEVAYTFGVRPLQQYLVRFSGGRLQCLTIAWDTEHRRWYSLYPSERILPEDWLHWTRGAQNWNGMCSECHSTNLRKGYNPDTDTYETTWSEIDVGCEACHGPGSAHVARARTPSGFAGGDDGLIISLSRMSPREQVEACAPCHARRFLLRDYEHTPGADLLDHMVPSLLDRNLYYPDGQIQDEVYVYASFLQSRMYREGVRCTDCHDPHSTRRVREGNDLCLKCHKADVYDTRDHHFHEETSDGKPNPGRLCGSCHMPERVYMGVDGRADHSFRVPRPDLSVDLGTPNACSTPACHGDKPAAWAARWTATWYGDKRPRHYGSILAKAREGRPEAREDLIDLIQDPNQPAMVRATAVSLIEAYRGPGAHEALFRALRDVESLVRWSAAGAARILPPGERAEHVGPLLRDPVEAVRAQAARLLAGTGGLRLGDAEETSLNAALDEYERTMRYQSDFPSTGYNLGNLYQAMGRPQDAERQFRRSLRIDPFFVRTRVNYASLLSVLGRNPEAEDQLRAALRAQPALPEASYNLGLLLAEMGRLEEAAGTLQDAARSLPDFARVHYNLGLVLSGLGRFEQADRAITRALILEPTNADFLFAMADLRIGRGDAAAAWAAVEAWSSAHPDDPRLPAVRAALAGMPAR